MIKRKFYQRNTLKVAQDLLGCFLVRKINRKVIKGIITETEAYVSEEDLACHASRGRTPRTEIMYGEAGRAYVYLIYGMYYCLNVVTEKKGYPAAVLIRGIRPSVTIRANSYSGKGCADNKNNKTLLNGPGKVCRYFKIDKKLNGRDMTKGDKLWIERKTKISAKGGSASGGKKSQIKKSKRIGVDYARHCRHYLWRFHLDF